MKALGWTLIVAGVPMSFCFCKWAPFSYIPPSRAIIRDVVGARDDNVIGAGFWGIVVPIMMGGGGIALIAYAGKKESEQWRRRQVRRTPQRSEGEASAGWLPTAEEAQSRLIPCPDCGRQVSRLARNCPQCGRPFIGQEDIQEKQ